MMTILSLSFGRTCDAERTGKCCFDFRVPPIDLMAGRRRDFAVDGACTRWKL